LIDSPFAIVSSHSTFPSFEIYGHFTTNFFFFENEIEFKIKIKIKKEEKSNLSHN